MPPRKAAHKPVKKAPKRITTKMLHDHDEMQPCVWMVMLDDIQFIVQRVTPDAFTLTTSMTPQDQPRFYESKEAAVRDIPELRSLLKVVKSRQNLLQKAIANVDAWLPQRAPAPVPPELMEVVHDDAHVDNGQGFQKPQEG